MAINLLPKPADNQLEGQGTRLHGGRLPAQVPTSMIQLTRLNSQPLFVNSDLIKFIEMAPDTVITLVAGEKVVVRESCDEILEKIVTFRRAVFAGVVAQPSMPSLQQAAASSPEADGEGD